MNRNKLYSWLIVGFTAAIMVLLVSSNAELPKLSRILFWFLLLAAVEVLPVSLGFRAEVTMGFPIHLAIAILFDPWLAMAIAGLAAVDLRELRRQIPLHRALFNRSQLMLSEGASAAVFYAYGSSNEHLTSLPDGALVVAFATVVHLVVNLILVSISVATEEGIPPSEAIVELLPRPVSGFFVSYALMAALGAATAVVYRRPGFGAWAVAVLFIPLTLARLTITGARTKQELSEQLVNHQKALLEASDRMFIDREQERHRIAEEIHDTSLQMLAAAAYGLGNAKELLAAGMMDKARDVLASSRDAIEGAMKALRGSLVDLRKSTVEEGGLVETMKHHADQTSVLWDKSIPVEGNILHEPPIPVALAAFQIFQEGLNNALKHAQGSPITVRINDGNGMVHIIVEDEGPGFDPEAEVGTDHVGMRLMRERAERVGGRIVFDTAPGRGTRLEAILPGGVEQ